jgi:DNA-binding response OmpR family regulator
VDVHVRHVREKLELEPREPEYIQTVRGVGYRFRER